MVDASALPRKFVLGPLKVHREDVLLNRERELLPATQAVIVQRTRVAAQDEVIRQLEADIRNARLARHRIARGEDDAAGGSDDARRAFVKSCPAEGCRGFMSTAYTWFGPQRA